MDIKYVTEQLSAVSARMQGSNVKELLTGIATKSRNLQNIDLSTFSDVKLPEFERTEFGYQILPDKSNGAGPIYFCLIKKQILSWFLSILHG